MVASLLVLTLVAGVALGSHFGTGGTSAVPGAAGPSGGGVTSGGAEERAGFAGANVQHVGDLENETGSGADDPVRVGIIGTRFDARDPALRPQVADVRRFDASGGRITHGTAVAEVVSHTLPDSELYLASVGREPSTDSYAEAVNWLVANDADVIVDAGSYFPQSTKAARRLASATRHATRSGVVFVTSAGNYRRRHWRGTGTTGGWVQFADEDVQVNPLDGGDPLGGRVSLRLSWNSSADYDLYLYRYRRNGESAVVAKSTTRENGTGGAIEAIDATVPRGRYYAAVYAENGTDDPGPVELFAAHHDLKYATDNGSVVTPVAMEGVIVVGAYDATNGSVAPYSSRGDNATEVDILAPELARTTASGPLRGTSAAAPYVAGAAAVMKSHNESLSPAAVERILERTADGNRVDPAAAVEAVDGVRMNATATNGNATATNGNATATNGNENATATNGNENATATNGNVTTVSHDSMPTPATAV
ncbi:MAG: S8 family serine peptidase [Haloferacaceae archaeon]